MRVSSRAAGRTCVRTDEQGATLSDVLAIEREVISRGGRVGIPALGAPVPMKRSPGVLAHTQPKTGGTTRMRGLVVDAVSGVHFLQRNDGTAVVGGNLKGYAVASSSSMEDAAPSLEEGARLVDPSKGGAADGLVTCNV